MKTTEINNRFNSGDWIILKENWVEEVRKGYENDEKEFERRYKYPRRIANIKHSGSRYPVYRLMPSGIAMIETAMYRLATDKELKKLEIKNMFIK